MLSPISRKSCELFCKKQKNRIRIGYVSVPDTVFSFTRHNSRNTFSFSPIIKIEGDKQRSELFSVDAIDEVAKVAATPEGGVYYGPRPTIENIVNLKMNIVDILIASLIDIAKADGERVWVLGRLVRQKPELAPQIIPVLKEAAKTDKSAKMTLFFLGEEKPELFK